MRNNIGLSRGKRVNNEEWIEGYFVKKFDPLLLTEMCFILVQEYDTSCIDGTPTVLKSEMTWYRVHPTTVGQCIGDAEYSAYSTIENPKNVFEGDYVDMGLHDGSKTGVVVRNGAKFSIYDKWGWYDIDSYYWLRVYDNIHDNPELLGGDDNVCSKS